MTEQQPPYLSVIVPAYKEAGGIQKSLRRFHEYLSGKNFTYEILVVSDGSPDSTIQEVEAISSAIPGLRWIDRKENRGKGYTVREGMLEAKGRIRLFADADNSTDIAHFDKMIPFFEQGKDVVICSREARDAAGARQAVKQPWHKRQLGNLGNLYIQLLVIPGIWDTQCGFKAFTASAAEAIFGAARIDRWGFDVEALGLARKMGFSISIVPAHWINDGTTTVTLGGYIHSLFEVAKVSWWLLTNSYHVKKRN